MTTRGVPSDPEPAKPIFALLARDPALVAERALPLLAERLGRIDFVSPAFPFDHTDYYAAELGDGLLRRLVSLERLASPEELVAWKLACAGIEELLSEGGRRRVNIDPGYLDHTKVVLGSFKPGRQKIYLSRGVYADPVLLYAKGRFEPFGWTFPDFASGRYDGALLEIRRLYKARQKAGRGPAPG
jgi:hypothetical protein